MPRTGVAVPPGNQHSEQNLQNWSFDNEFGVFMVESVGYDGQNLQRQSASNLQLYLVNDGTYDYVCFSAPGTALATAKWKIIRAGSSGVMYADANANYDNVATDPTLLTYGYT